MSTQSEGFDFPHADLRRSIEPPSHRMTKKKLAQFETQQMAEMLEGVRQEYLKLAETFLYSRLTSYMRGTLTDSRMYEDLKVLANHSVTLSHIYKMALNRYPAAIPESLLANWTALHRYFHDIRNSFDALSFFVSARAKNGDAKGVNSTFDGDTKKFFRRSMLHLTLIEKPLREVIFRDPSGEAPPLIFANDQKVGHLVQVIERFFVEEIGFSTTLQFSTEISAEIHPSDETYFSESFFYCLYYNIISNLKKAYLSKIGQPQILHVLLRVTSDEVQMIFDDCGSGMKFADGDVERSAIDNQPFKRFVPTPGVTGFEGSISGSNGSGTGISSLDAEFRYLNDYFKRVYSDSTPPVTSYYELNMGSRLEADGVTVAGGRLEIRAKIFKSQT